jgi:CTP:molybdopterin cytidylyltransferase MocA
VLGRGATEVAAALPAGRQQIIVNPDFATGMASSLRAGLEALPAAAAGALILLGDQPLVTPEIVARLLAEVRRSPTAIVAAAYAGKRGHPVYFPQDLFPDLRAVSGDEGGRSVVAAQRDRLRIVDFGELPADHDVDRPEDYAELVANWSRYRPQPPR